MSDDVVKKPEASAETPPDPKIVGSDGSVMPPYRCIIPICRNHPNGFSIEGSAFFVAPQVLLTACHVLYDQEEKLTDLFAILFYGENSYLQVPLQVLHEETARDIAICAVERPAPARPEVAPFVFPCARTAKENPVLGSLVSTYAYHRSVVNLREGQIRVDLNPSGQSGKALKPVTRKGVLQLTADFKLEALSSGGPLFNEDGHVCGINSSSFAFCEPGEELSFFASVVGFQSQRFRSLGREMTLDDLLTRRLVAG